MKKLSIVLVIVLICTMAAGCSGSELQMLKQKNEELSKKVSELETSKIQQGAWYKAEEFSNAMKLFDEYIEGAAEKSGVAKPDALQEVKVDRVSERYWLISYKIAPLYPLTNYFYALVDMEKGSCEAINLDSIDYISEVTYDEGTITFHSEGNNVVNGFRDFPHDLKYDIAKKELTTEYPYKSLEHGEYEILLGNGANRIGLGKVTESNKSIYFDFEEVKDTILAGGWFCPRIRTGLTLEFENERSYYVDFEALVLAKEAEKQILALKELEYIKDVRIRSYKDVHEIEHTAVYFKFEGVDEYACSLPEDSTNGFRDFTVTVR